MALNPDGSFTYTPDVGFSGTDTFTYTASDAMDYSAPATVTVAVGLAPEEVSDVFGGAFGYFTNVGLFGGAREDRGPAPSVTLPRTGGNLSATDPDGDAAIYGPAYIFENHGALNVHTEGTTRPRRLGHELVGGRLQRGGQRPLPSPRRPTARSPAPARANSTRRVGLDPHRQRPAGRSTPTSTPVTRPRQIDFDHDYDPAPNTEFNGALDHVGDQWRIVFNEQILGPDSITVNALHMYLLGPTALGEMIIGQSRCGVRAAAPNAAPVAADDTYTVTQGQPPLDGRRPRACWPTTPTPTPSP